ncbi:RTP2 [Acrasis kona]|uniref:RTP2 n=1 Tax=Acrasis kona TaxID=1008807 RepID=A0AAW2YIR1_9EUKA
MKRFIIRQFSVSALMRAEGHTKVTVPNDQKQTNKENKEEPENKKTSDEKDDKSNPDNIMHKQGP